LIEQTRTDPLMVFGLDHLLQSRKQLRKRSLQFTNGWIAKAPVWWSDHITTSDSLMTSSSARLNMNIMVIH